MQIGDAIVFVDPHGIPHNAVITIVWDNGKPEEYPNPGVNLVYVSDDLNETDQYGRQIKRNTSVVHRSNQSAHGMYWKRNEE